MSIGPPALKLYSFVERLIIVTLLIMLMVVVILSTGTFTSMLIGRIGVKLAGGVGLDDAWAQDLHHRMGLLRAVFSAFLLILIGIELMQTIVMYLRSRVLHVEVVITVAIIAIARHTIDLDIEDSSPLHLMGIGFLLLALAVAYYYFRRAIAETRDGDVGGPPGASE